MDETNQFSGMIYVTYLSKQYAMSMHDDHQGRRDFMAKSFKTILIGSLSGAVLLSGCQEKNEEKEVSPPEDLMQEHGLLNRILLIYDHCGQQLTENIDFPLSALSAAAGIIRTFVEDYHEKQEEQYLFPRFKKAGQLTSLVEVLLVQHKAGRHITDQIMQLTRATRPTATDKQQLTVLLDDFNRMYRPHEAREDTVLFPAFRKIVSKHEYDALGEEFENNEHKLFGNDGFELMVAKVENIERSLGIYELSAFTPKVT